MFPDRFAPADAHECSWIRLQNAHAKSFKRAYRNISIKIIFNSQAPDVPEFAYRDIFHLLRLSVKSYGKAVKKRGHRINVEVKIIL